MTTRRVLRCNKCGQIGHNTGICPDRMKSNVPPMDRVFMADAMKIPGVASVTTRIHKEDEKIKRTYDIIFKQEDLKKKYPILDRDDVRIID